MSLAFLATLKGARMTPVRDALNTGSGTASFKIYTSPRPATGATPTGATLLATHSINYPCGTIDGNGDLALDIAAESTIAASGTPSWARFFDRDGAFVCDGSVGMTGSNADIEIGAAELFAGNKLTPTSAYLRDG